MLYTEMDDIFYTENNFYLGVDSRKIEVIRSPIRINAVQFLKLELLCYSLAPAFIGLYFK